MAQFLRPNGIITAGLWTGDPSDADWYLDIDEAVRSDTDFVESAKNQTTLGEASLSSAFDPQSPDNHTFRYVIRMNAAKTVTVVVRLMQGSTTIGGWTHVDPSTTFTLFERTTLAAITDYTDLRVQLDVTVNAGANAWIECSWVELEVPAPIVSTVSPAFLGGQDISVDGQYAYLLGSINVADAKSAWLAGGLLTSDNQFAYLFGNVAVLDNQFVYLHGKDLGVDDTPAYIEGIIPAVVDDIFAFLAGGVEVSDNQPVYLTGPIPVSATPISAYLVGTEQILDPDADTIRNEWMKENLETDDLYISLADPSDATYVQKEHVGLNEFFEVGMVDPGDFTEGVIFLEWRAWKIDSTEITTLKAELRQGETIICSDEQTLSDAPQTFHYDLTPAEKALITVPTDLRVRITVTGIVP